jgi:plasmid maintenance system killer protein
MQLGYTRLAIRQLERASFPTRRLFYKQAELLRQNLRHPSLHAKKYDEAENVWQARVNRRWRFYFVVRGNVYLILSVIPHPK